MRRISALALCALIAVPLQAQQRGEGSVYSRYGLGELSSSSYSSKSSALGGGGLAYGSTTFANLTNPASLSDQVFTRLSGGMRFEAVRTTDALDVQSTFSSNSFDGLSIGLPLKSSKLGMGMGFSKLTRVSYLIDVVKPLDLGSEVDSGDEYGARFQGTGGLNQISVGAGYRFNPSISVGLRGDAVFGVIEDIQGTVFNDARFTDTRVVRSTRMHGYTLGLGVRATARSVIRDGDFLNFGGALDLPYDLNGTRTVFEGEGLSVDTLNTAIDGSASMPLSVAAGVLYQPSPVLSFNADFRYEPWADFESTFSFPGYAPAGVSNFSNRTRISGGIEYFPAGRDLFASYLERTAYRVGFFREAGYVSPDAAERVNTFGVTSGLSLPTLSAGTRIDINLDVGTRGSATGRLVQDRFIRFGLHFNFAERWFARRQLG
ncbi:MAG: hypothetical protein JJ896_09290 [Rhodothermales bacterium]|nr:hypothetical protein [Rhodothermales bacterium]MBO6779831.1 hypothetical protein [Rhodothermales bacterium]